MIGVSYYEHFPDGKAPTELGYRWGMSQLSCAARSAAEVANWLATDYSANNPQRPLQTLRVLLSPVPGEKVPPLRGVSPRPATSANVAEALREFVDDCKRNPDDVAFVYVAGHGVQLTGHDAIVLLSDVGSPRHLAVLDGAINVTACHSAMSHADTASTQFWFVDACRLERSDIVREFATLKGAITIDLPVRQSRDELEPASRAGDRPESSFVSPIFLATSSQETAWANERERSVFCQALLESLRGAMAEPDGACPDWHVSTYSLAERLKRRVQEIAHAYGKKQHVETNGRWGKAVVHRLPPPLVRLKVNLLPSQAAPFTSASLLRNAKTPVRRIPKGWPLITDIDPGIYLLTVTAKAPFNSSVEDILDVKPPTVDRDVEVG
ncbi:MAG TPA: caspase family protein [Kofleriaceae bacterium]|nr:caspase family protein [Kofleriaceae bacterium]